ncbi:MAG TPA: NnrU family protein [Candidatus Baltobacteraceae bacterium]|jgi:protein-S-isoprenylcysteine O-methyltransferase Ste14|nr:NnrU family protein [Candidatus Baltobacteraceae bacterium]
MNKVLMLAFGIFAYAVFLISLLWAVAFLGNFGLPLTADSPPRSGVLFAVLVDLGILALFAVQHTIMARPQFKQRWTTIVPAPIERSIFVLAASLILIFLFVAWQPIAGLIWNARGALRTAIYVLYASGWIFAIASTFQINHWDVFGLRQVLGPRTNVTHEEPGLRTPFMYRIVRHPLMLGLLIAFWSSPIMTAGHLLFSLASTVYIVAGTWFEERDLVKEFGNDYITYREHTPGLVPFPRRRT